MTCDSEVWVVMDVIRSRRDDDGTVDLEDDNCSYSEEEEEEEGGSVRCNCTDRTFRGGGGRMKEECRDLFTVWTGRIFMSST